MKSFSALRTFSRRRLAAAVASIALLPALSHAGDYTQTRYPIVLAHGLLGFKQPLLGFVEYWPGIAESLEKDGARVFITDVSAVNSSYVRGEQLLAQVEQIVAITGAQKVNLIGHSQGALDIRYVASVRPELVASITSVGGGNQVKLDATPINSSLGKGLISGLGVLINTLGMKGDLPNDTEALARTFSAEGIAEFNRRYPIGLPSSYCGEGAHVEYVRGYPVQIYSWSGTKPVTNLLDPVDGAFLLTSTFFKPEANDGLVTQCGSHLGKVIRDDYRMNHLDEVNLMFGLVSPFEVNPKTIYRIHANRLKNAGL